MCADFFYSDLVLVCQILKISFILELIGKFFPYGKHLTLKAFSIFQVMGIFTIFWGLVDAMFSQTNFQLCIMMSSKHTIGANLSCLKKLNNHMSLQKQLWTIHLVFS